FAHKRLSDMAGVGLRTHPFSAAAAEPPAGAAPMGLVVFHRPAQLTPDPRTAANAERLNDQPKIVRPQRVKRRSIVLSDKSRSVIQATLPAVSAHIQEIAQCFYRHLFTAHPELLDGTFNRGNQADGSQQQALAGAVAAFATALVKTPDRLPENLLARIAHKHT